MNNLNENATGEQVEAAVEQNEVDKGAEKETQTKDTAKSYDETYVQKLKEQHQMELQKAVEEAVKKATMNEEEKAAYEQKAYEQKSAEREKSIALRELKADAKEILSEKEVPNEFLDMVLGNDLEETKRNVDTFKTKFDAAVQKQVKTLLKGETPKTGSGIIGTGTSVMAAQIDKYL